MKLILILVLSFFSFNVFAKNCEEIESSKLKSFSKKELVDKYCSYKSTVTDVKIEWDKELKSDLTNHLAIEKKYGEILGKAMSSCRTEQERVKQILKSKYKIGDKEVEHCYIPEMLLGLPGEP